MQTESRLTCPACGHQSTETMPSNACQFFYDCAGCGIRLKPKPGDCCVFCSYGTVPCPPMQNGKSVFRREAMHLSEKTPSAQKGGRLSTRCMSSG
jgi:hypothetical protein